MFPDHNGLCDQRMRKRYAQLLSEFMHKERKTPIPKGNIYSFENLGLKLAFNPSVPFTIYSPNLKKKIRVMYVRVESLSSNWLDPTIPYDSQAVLYYEVKDGLWRKVSEEVAGFGNGLVFNNMEDPFISFIHEEIIFGGVVMAFPAKRTQKIPVESKEHFDYTKTDVTVTTQFYRGKTLDNLTHFATIRNMKDIRLGELSDGSILVATRPQGGDAGLGRIGLTRVKRLDEINQKTIEDAILINDLVCFDIKLGALGVYSIGLNHEGDNECAGVIGVMAYSDPQNKWHYFATAFKVYNTYTFEYEGIKHSPIEVIAWRKNWKMGLTKRPQTENVIFPAGIIKKDGNTVLVSGLSDAQTGELIISDPFTS